MVSSARNAPSSTTVNFGVSSAVEISVPLADLRAEHAQPPRRQQAGVDREQVVARGVHQPLGRPHLPADAAAHRVIALAQPQRRASAHRSPSAPRKRPAPPASPPASTRERARCASIERRGVADGPADHGQPGSRARPAATRPTALTSPRRRAPTPARGRGRSSGHGWRALPDFTAGEPFQYCPFLPCRPHPSPGRRRRSCRPSHPAAASCAHRWWRRCRS